MATLKYDPELASKGTWKGAKWGPRRTAIVSCPGCGQSTSISQHTIDADGKVTPSLVCPFGCGFHDFVTLENWKP